jgi:DNA-binding LytR/AlgR family response regulator
VNGLHLFAVDDELPALDDLTRMLKAVRGVERVDAAASAEEALLAFSDAESVDGVFLDVRMPRLDGIELGKLLRRFDHPPELVFVSAYDEFAIEAFRLAALDFVVKPVTQERLDEAVERVARATRSTRIAEEALDADVLPVDAPHGAGTRLLARDSILYLNTHGDYVRVASTEGRYLMRARLSDLAERWSGQGFARVHRAFVINLRRVVEVRPRLNGTADVLMPDGVSIPIARRHLNDLRRMLRLG